MIVWINLNNQNSIYTVRNSVSLLQGKRWYNYNFVQQDINTNDPCEHILQRWYFEMYLAWQRKTKNNSPKLHLNKYVICKTLKLLEHLQLHNGLQHWLHSMALRISKLFYLWLTPADPSKIFDPINALHSGLGSFLPIFGGHRAFLRNLTSGWPWLTRVWPLTPAMHYTLVMGSFHQIWWP